MMMILKVMIMNNGQIVAADTPSHLGLVLQERLVVDIQIEGAQDKAVKALESIPGVFQVEIQERTSDNILKYRVEYERDKDIYAELNGRGHKNKWVLREIKPVEMTLEEIFLKVVSEGKESKG